MFEQLSEIMRPPSAEVIAQKEFEDASRELLKAQSAKEYAEALVTYHKARVERLTEFLKRC
jgi:hypothetical protein